jgi:hypothetical protein
MSFKKFTSIDKFADSWLMMQKQEIGKMQFRSKIKLHGTNAAVRISNGEVSYQKRTGDITPLADNAGFASFAYTVNWKTDEDIIIYGEWAGPGVQKSDAICMIPQKMFFVFGVLWQDHMITEPNLIREYVPYHERIMILPWFDEPTMIDTFDVETAKALSVRLDNDVNTIGNEDPFVKEHFGVSGAGEGLVVSPYFDNGVVPLWMFNTFTFKVKSEAHLVQKTKSPNSSIYIEIPGSIKDFCDQFVTDNRCEQMVSEHLGGSYALQGMGTFLKELNADILKESKNEFAELGVDWKMVAKEINKRAVEWLKEKHKV